MRLIDKLVYKDLIGPFVVGMALFVMLIFTLGFLGQAIDLALQGVPILIVIQFGLCALPQIVTQCFPIAMLMAALMGFGRLSGDSEAVAVFAAGVSFTRMARAVFILGAVTSVVAFVWNETVVPPATRRMWDLKQQAVQHIAKSDRPLAYDIPGNDGTGISETVKVSKGYDAHTQTLRDVTVVKYSSASPWNGGVQAVIHCKYARPGDSHELDQRGLNWTYFDCTFTIFTQDSTSKRMFANTTYFENAHVLPRGAALGKSFNEILNTQVQDSNRLSFAELKREIVRDQAQGKIMEARGKEVDLYGKLALPLASFIFGVMGAALGLNTRRGGSGKTVGFGMAIFIVFIYYIVYHSMYAVGKNGGLPPMLASFLADILGAIAGVFLIMRSSR